MNSTIKPTHIGVLIAALVANMAISAVLILWMSRFDEARRQAQEATAQTEAKRGELNALAAEVQSLATRKAELEPKVADWEKRLKEKALAEAALATLDAKKIQAEADTSKSAERLDAANRSVLEAEKQKIDLGASLVKLKADFAALTRTNSYNRALVGIAAAAEHRLAEATNAVVSANARRQRLQDDVVAAQARLDQLQKEADEARQIREKAIAESATLRQQMLTLREQADSLDEQVAKVKALQAAAKQEDETLAQLQQKAAIAEARTTEMELRQNRAQAELAQLTNRANQVRAQAVDWDGKASTSAAAATQAGHELAEAQKLLAATKAEQDQLARAQVILSAQIAALKNDQEQARKDADETEARLLTTRGALQKADADLAAVRNVTQDFTARHDESIRESAGLEAAIELLKKEKEALEKEVGRLEGQRQSAPRGKQ